MAVIIDGRKIAVNIREQVKDYIKDLPEKPRFAVIQVGDNPASSVYVKNKLKACRDAGIETVAANLDTSISQESLLGLIAGFNNSPAYHGLLVQLPLPDHINVEAVIEALSPEKDVDGFHPTNVGRLAVRSHLPYLHPCTPWGIVHMLDTYFPKTKDGSGLKGKRVAVIGQSHIVGRPVSVMLQNEGATVIMIDINTKDIYREVQGADVVITATGVAGLVNQKLFDAVANPDVTIIDAGIAKVDGKVVGDVDPALYPQLKSYSPVPGGVGPVTIAFLVRNILKAYCIQNNLEIPSFKGFE